MTIEQKWIIIIMVCVWLNVWAYIIDWRAWLLMTLATVIDKVASRKLFDR